MGWGLPAAVGAAFATGRRVICITGDGGLMMNVQELATVAHHKLNIKIFVLNNGGYLTIKQTQEMGFEGRLMGVNSNTGLCFPHWGDLAEAHRLPMYYLTSSPRHPMREQIKEVLGFSGPWMCEVMMNPNQQQAPRAVNRRNPDGTMNPTRLEDSFPFLPPEVIEREMQL